MAQTNSLEPPIDATVEVETITFDYGRLLNPGVTLTTIVLMACTISSLNPNGGSDLNPQSRLIGSPQIVVSPKTGAAGSAVAQLFGTAVANVEYLIQCAASTSDGQMLSLWTHLQAQQPL
jgi:hypothetical protein